MQPWAEAMYAADPDPLRTGIRRFIYERRNDREYLDHLVEEVQLEQVMGVDMVAYPPLPAVNEIEQSEAPPDPADMLTAPGRLLAAPDLAQVLPRMWMKSVRSATRQAKCQYWSAAASLHNR